MDDFYKNLAERLGFGRIDRAKRLWYCFCYGGTGINPNELTILNEFKGVMYGLQKKDWK